MPVRIKPFRMMFSEMFMQALEELQRENEINATTNASLPARAVSSQIRQTISGVKSLFDFAEEMRYPDTNLVAISDSDEAVMEWAILEFMWNVRKNFSDGQHFRIRAEEMLKEWDDHEWRVPVFGKAAE